MKRVLIIAILFGSNLASFADCPQPAEISQICVKQGCNWLAPGYEGFNENHSNPSSNATIANFIYAEWATKYGSYSKSDGTTLCHYLTNENTPVMLVQNNWGHVPEPTGNNWQLIVNGKDNALRVCQTDCHFVYNPA